MSEFGTFSEMIKYHQKSEIEENKKEVLKDFPKIINCGRWDLNPHDRIDHKILSLARLPVPTLPHFVVNVLRFAAPTFDIIAKHDENVNT